MAITVLNNMSSLQAQNALVSTQANLQKARSQLSTGMKINSGADDAAGLSIVSGLNANIAALTQSQQNANNGIGMLQTADGALSQVTTLLNRAVTLATEGSNSGLSSSQGNALQSEFSSILSEIGQIGNTTDFNGKNVFSSNSPTSFTSTQASLVTAGTDVIAAGSITINDAKTGGTFIYTSTGAAGNTVAALNTAIGAAVTAGTLSSAVTGNVGTGNEVISESSGSGITVSSTSSTFGPMVAAASSGSNTVFLGDGTTSSAANTQITTPITALTTGASGLNLDQYNLSGATGATGAQNALVAISAAIDTIASQRGTIGASINRLTAATSVMTNQVTNLQSAANGLANADIGKTVANMTQYNVLQSTGMAALQQANQAQQAVLKLVQ